MKREEIERCFLDAGWRLDGSFSGHLVIGEDGDSSILAHRWVWGVGDPVFELCDGITETTYWVREIPTPERASRLLEEHGGPSGEERGKANARRGSAS